MIYIMTCVQQIKSSPLMKCHYYTQVIVSNHLMLFFPDLILVTYVSECLFLVPRYSDDTESVKMLQMVKTFYKRNEEDNRSTTNHQKVCQPQTERKEMKRLKPVCRNTADLREIKQKVILKMLTRLVQVQVDKARKNPMQIIQLLNFLTDEMALEKD